MSNTINLSIVHQEYLMAIKNKLISIENIIKKEIQRFVSKGEKRIQNRDD
jgi:hypothetical protein